MASIFSKIIAGEIPCYKIAENENFLAFLDVFPVVAGHTLVVPKIETDYIFDMNEAFFLDFFSFAKKIEPAIRKAIPCIKVGIAVIGLEVPHAHIHLLPMNSMDDINFSKPKLKLTPEELSSIADSIRKYLN